MLLVRSSESQFGANCWNIYEGYSFFPLELLGGLDKSLGCLVAILL